MVAPPSTLIGQRPSQAILRSKAKQGQETALTRSSQRESGPEMGRVQAHCPGRSMNCLSVTGCPHLCHSVKGDNDLFHSRKYSPGKGKRATQKPFSESDANLHPYSSPSREPGIILLLMRQWRPRQIRGLKVRHRPRPDLGQDAASQPWLFLVDLERESVWFLHVTSCCQSRDALGTLEEVGLIRFLAPFLETLPAHFLPQ